jgi:hypothetical protein
MKLFFAFMLHFVHAEGKTFQTSAAAFDAFCMYVIESERVSECGNKEEKEELALKVALQQ